MDSRDLHIQGGQEQATVLWCLRCGSSGDIGGHSGAHLGCQRLDLCDERASLPGGAVCEDTLDARRA